MLNYILYGTHFVPIRFNKLLKTIFTLDDSVFDETEHVCRVIQQLF